jgi:hypothetical protein
MIVTCNDTECKYYSNAVCTAPTVDHTADRFCITGRRKPHDENYNGLMTVSNPNCHSKGGKYKSNRVALIK